MAFRGIPSVPPSPPETRSFQEALKENLEQLIRDQAAILARLDKIDTEIVKIKALL